MSPLAPISFNKLKPLTGPDTLRPFPETAISADGTSISYVTVPKTDWWRTPQEARFSGPVLGMHIPAELASSKEGWTVGVELSGDWKIEFDQACLMVYQSPTQWLKTGIEYAHGDANISVVAVHPYSDWSLFPSPLPSGHPLKVRIAYGPNHGLAISAVLSAASADEDDAWTLIREVRDWPVAAGEPVWVGVGGCSPHPGSEEGEKEGCKVTFKDFSLA